MEFYISVAAADYIKQKGGEIIIFKGNLMSCCGGTKPNPMLDVGHPAGRWKITACSNNPE